MSDDVCAVSQTQEHVLWVICMNAVVVFLFGKLSALVRPATRVLYVYVYVLWLCTGVLCVRRPAYLPPVDACSVPALPVWIHRLQGHLCMANGEWEDFTHKHIHTHNHPSIHALLFCHEW